MVSLGHNELMRGATKRMNAFLCNEILYKHVLGVFLMSLIICSSFKRLRPAINTLRHVAHFN